ncbi:MAG TPA: hypothetical protein VFH43_09030, partial [Candidatus Kapabacteria bacterium]|nr:hypothetical protein [Candidatus Kapabacteria bacterium]
IKTSTGWVPPEVDDEVLTSINKADFKSEAQPDAETLAMLKQSSIPERYVDPEKLEPKVRNLLKKEMKEMNKEDR